MYSSLSNGTPFPPSAPSTLPPNASVLGLSGAGQKPSQGIWNSFLSAVAASKSVPSKHVIVMGDSRVGKTTLINTLRGQTTDEVASIIVQTVSDGNAAASGMEGKQILVGGGVSQQQKRELALSYSYMEVKDEDDADVIARIGWFHVAPHPEHGSLIPYALQHDPNALGDSLALIVLDWTEPWKFVESLERWLSVLEREILGIVQSREGEDARISGEIFEDLCLRVELYMREYSETVGAQANGVEPASGENTQPVLGLSTPLYATTTHVPSPLPQGALTKNLGIPIVVVCTKSDNMIALEREKDFRDDQFDYIQQTLRTICLKYGAALIYTSINKPTTLLNLRSYVLHRLFPPPLPSYASHLTVAAADGSSATPQLVFPFQKSAQFIEREPILIPSGWDSWGKIKVLRESFEVEAMSGEVSLSRAQDGENGYDENDEVQRGYDHDEATAVDFDSDGGWWEQARMLYEEVIVNPRQEQIHRATMEVVAEDEQSFLDSMIPSLEKLDGPGGAGAMLVGPPSMAPSMSRTSSTMAPSSPPMGLGSPSMAMDYSRTGSNNSGDYDDLMMSRRARKDMSQISQMSRNPMQPPGSAEKLRNEMSSMSTMSPISAGGSSASTAAAAAAAANALGVGATSPASTAAQTEMIQNFFQNLLVKKSATSAGVPLAPTGSMPQTPGSPPAGGAASPLANLMQRNASAAGYGAGASGIAMGRTGSAASRPAPSKPGLGGSGRTDPA
ncbi:dynein light intermediate chain-domain-containing protein [Cladochytrium replicatum]|nr:dynein light intermediate chain-domain-containing protein [Cladochytrium replicatum]